MENNCKIIEIEWTLDHQKKKEKTKMQISPIQQNNTSFKAYIKPNANFHILYGKPPKKDKTVTTL